MSHVGGTGQSAGSRAVTYVRTYTYESGLRGLALSLVAAQLVVAGTLTGQARQFIRVICGNPLLVKTR
jgi:hypothetical protein